MNQDLVMFKSPEPWYGEFSSMIGGVYTLEGLIGVGKSTAGRSIERFLEGQGFKVRFYPEFVNQTFLNAYINDMKRYAFTFQSVMLCKRIEIYNNAMEFAKTGGIAIVDRSLIGDLTFAVMQTEAGNISPEDFEIYQSLITDVDRLSPRRSIYLDCHPEVAMRRIQRRGNTSEVNGYTLGYLQTLQAAYQQSMSGLTPIVQQVVVDWNNDREMTDDGFMTDNEVIELLRYFK